MVRLRNTILYAMFPVLDVGTLFLLADYVGTWVTLAIVLVSSVTGILMCFRHLGGFVERNEKLSKQYRGSIPNDIKLVSAYDGLTTFFLMFLFLFPGLLSDLAAFIFLLPQFRKNYFERFVNKLREAAEKEGKTLEEFLLPRSNTDR